MGRAAVLRCFQCIQHIGVNGPFSNMAWMVVSKMRRFSERPLSAEQGGRLSHQPITQKLILLIFTACCQILGAN